MNGQQQQPVAGIIWMNARWLIYAVHSSSTALNVQSRYGVAVIEVPAIPFSLFLLRFVNGDERTVIRKSTQYIQDSCLNRHGRLSLNQVFRNEALNFTPWLSGQHVIEEIASAVFGIDDAVLWKTECPVGDYRMDMVYHQRNDRQNAFIVENQFGLSDSKHLGQIVAYARLTGIRKILWIADEIAPEHRDIADMFRDVDIVPCSVSLTSQNDGIHFLFTTYHHPFSVTMHERPGGD